MRVQKGANDARSEAVPVVVVKSHRPAAVGIADCIPEEGMPRVPHASQIALRFCNSAGRCSYLDKTSPRA